MQRRFHYEQAFEHYLRANRVPYVAVDEAKKSLIPPDHAASGLSSLKSFDFVVYGPTGRNLLVDVKGRAHSARSGRRLENWVTDDDIECLDYWGNLFGPGFAATFVFIYWCRAQPPDVLFDELFEFSGRWYALREVPLEEYRKAMIRRSPRWRTWSVPAAAFAQVSRPFTIRSLPGRPSVGRLRASSCVRPAAAVS